VHKYYRFVDGPRKFARARIEPVYTSGEYAMIDAAEPMGRLNRDAIMLEALTSMKRAGADRIITRFARRAAEVLERKTRSVYAQIEEGAPEEALATR
jgi:delta-aminolevulinic acid dehydratase/porphobilinogen synthase